ncbi:MAG: hypothetical protein HS126_05235 [Anaerolineales bacterium]|nr:hypothetical protein [Anaerolineales bacterium]
MSTAELASFIEAKYSKALDEINLKEGQVTLQPIVMRIPNSYGVYSPSKLEPQKKIYYEEFLSRYAEYPREIRVCLDETPTPSTLFQRSKLITAYGFGLDCWYIVVANSIEDDTTIGD